MADYLNRYPHMVHEYYTGKLRQIMDERRARIAALQTQKTRKIMFVMFGKPLQMLLSFLNVPR